MIKGSDYELTSHAPQVMDSAPLLLPAIYTPGSQYNRHAKKCFELVLKDFPPDAIFVAFCNQSTTGIHACTTGKFMILHPNRCGPMPSFFHPFFFLFLHCGYCAPCCWTLLDVVWTMAHAVGKDIVGYCCQSTPKVVPTATESCRSCT